jgi:hypothetical protein
VAILKITDMKNLLFCLLLSASTSMFGQRIGRFTDSITLNTQRTWVDIDGSRFSEIGDDCNYGIEMTFIEEDHRVIVKQCHEGEWKEFLYRFEVIIDDDEHFIELYDEDEKLDDYELEAQMITLDGVNFTTELTLFYYRDKKLYTLRSIK